METDILLYRVSLYDSNGDSTSGDSIGAILNRMISNGVVFTSIQYHFREILAYLSKFQ